MIENGKREPRLGDLRSVAKALGVSLEQLLAAEPLPKRAQLEIELERAQRGPLFDCAGARPVAACARALSDEAIETIVALHAELDRLHRERAATPEEARRANTELRRQMRTQNNYFPELEARRASCSPPSSTPAGRCRSGSPPTWPRTRLLAALRGRPAETPRGR